MEMKIQITEKNRDLIKEALSCPDCIADKKVACARNPDAQCLSCGRCYCGHHIGRHLRKVHLISATWRGDLKR